VGTLSSSLSVQTVTGLDTSSLSRGLTGMVQIKISEAPKPGLESEAESLTTVTSTTPSVLPEIRAVRVVKRNKSSKSCGITFFLFFLLSVSFLATVKRLCDYKEENFRLLQELAFERQKDALLKQTVKSNVPEARFALLSKVPVVDFDVEVPGGGVSRGWFSVNLMVLWRSPTITPCDMARLSHQLSMEIYQHSDVIDIVQAQRMKESETVEKYYEEDSEEIEVVLNQDVQSTSEPEMEIMENIIEELEEEELEESRDFKRDP